MEEEDGVSGENRKKAKWWSRWDSNPRPPRCHRGALPTAPRPHRYRQSTFYNTRCQKGQTRAGNDVSGSWGLCREDRKSTRLNSSHPSISYAVFCLKKKKKKKKT